MLQTAVFINITKLVAWKLSEIAKSQPMFIVYFINGKTGSKFKSINRNIHKRNK